jgi:hypothetical protein
MDGGDTSLRRAKCHESLDEKQKELPKPFGVGFRNFDISGFGILTIPMTRRWGTLH